MQKLYSLSALSLLTILTFIVGCAEPPSPTETVNQYYALMQDQKYDALIQFYTQEIIDEAKKIQAATGKTPSEMFKEIHIMNPFTSWKIIKEIVNGNTADIQVELSLDDHHKSVMKHRLELIKGAWKFSGQWTE